MGVLTMSELAGFGDGAFSWLSRKRPVKRSLWIGHVPKVDRPYWEKAKVQALSEARETREGMTWRTRPPAATEYERESRIRQAASRARKLAREARIKEERSQKRRPAGERAFLREIHRLESAGDPSAPAKGATHESFRNPVFSSLRAAGMSPEMCEKWGFVERVLAQPGGGVKLFGANWHSHSDASLSNLLKVFEPNSAEWWQIKCELRSRRPGLQWRQQSPGIAQIQLARKWGLRPPPNATRGDVLDMILRAKKQGGVASSQSWVSPDLQRARAEDAKKKAAAKKRAEARKKAAAKRAFRVTTAAKRQPFQIKPWRPPEPKLDLSKIQAAAKARYAAMRVGSATSLPVPSYLTMGP